MINNNTTYETIKSMIGTIVKGRVGCFVAKKSRLPYSKETVIRWVKTDLANLGYDWDNFDTATKKMVREESILWANAVLAQYQMKFDIGGRFYEK